ncbi:MAG: thiamine pyrophosphate-binding protein [Burkholderiaceae bacterium]|nr:thiamine pyrophosphate-binding protein [Burkholderiaceae bacterium]
MVFLHSGVLMLKQRSGGQILVDALQIHGAELVFGVPGESFLPILDALIDSPIRFITNRHEGGAAFMAEAYGKMTGRPGICCVTRGPGATNASIGVHTAYQDSTPMILLIGQVGSDFVEREAFQEMDYRRMFGEMSKWVAQIDRADRIPEYMARAFQVATSGRPGPVVLALPEDMLNSTAGVADAIAYSPVQAAPAAAQLAQLQTMLTAAQRPLVLLGGSGWNQAACAAMRGFAEANRLPVACAFRFQDLLDNEHPNYVGDVGFSINPKLAARIREADLVLAIGPRLGEITTAGYSLLEAPRPKQKLIHVHADAEELGRVYQADLMINSGMPQIAEALAAMPPVAVKHGVSVAAWLAEAQADLEAWRQEPPTCKGEVKLNLWQVMRALQASLPADTIVTNGAGNFATWAHRFWRYGGYAAGSRTQLAPTAGAMGYGVPAAVAARIISQHHGKPRSVLNVAGDGDFLMTGQEVATAVQYGAGVLFVVFNNSMLGTIRMHQEKNYPARVSGTDLRNPDFAALARAYGAHGDMVETTAQFAPALQRALAHIAATSLPALIELRYDGSMLTPNAGLEAIRKTGLATQQSK